MTSPKPLATRRKHKQIVNVHVRDKVCVVHGPHRFQEWRIRLGGRLQLNPSVFDEHFQSFGTWQQICVHPNVTRLSEFYGRIQIQIDMWIKKNWIFSYLLLINWFCFYLLQYWFEFVISNELTLIYSTFLFSSVLLAIGGGGGNFDWSMTLPCSSYSVSRYATTAYRQIIKLTISTEAKTE